MPCEAACHWQWTTRIGPVWLCFAGFRRPPVWVGRATDCQAPSLPALDTIAPSNQLIGHGLQPNDRTHEPAALDELSRPVWKRCFQLHPLRLTHGQEVSQSARLLHMGHMGIDMYRHRTNRNSINKPDCPTEGATRTRHGNSFIGSLRIPCPYYSSILLYSLDIQVTRMPWIKKNTYTSPVPSQS